MAMRKFRDVEKKRNYFSIVLSHFFLLLNSLPSDLGTAPLLQLIPYRISYLNCLSNTNHNH